MAVSDPSSESEEDYSENVNKDVQFALNVIKDRLAKHGRAQNTPTSPRRNSYLRKKLYETFSSNMESSSESENESSCEKRKSNQTMTNFFIDRASGSSESATLPAHNDSTEGIETVDLSNLDLTAFTDNKQVDTSVKNMKTKRKKKKNKDKSHVLSSELKSGISTDDVYVNVDPLSKQATQKQGKVKELKHKEPEIMKKSVFKDDYEKQDSIETIHTSDRQKKKERKLEREKTKGDKWYHMPAVELTEEQKNDLKVIQMRKALDPKRFYKANDSETTPKFVQFGRVIESAADFYDSRIPKKQRKATIVEELLADTEFRKYNKRKYEEIQESRRLGKGPYAHMKRMKKQKK